MLSRPLLNLQSIAEDKWQLLRWTFSKEEGI